MSRNLGPHLSRLLGRVLREFLETCLRRDQRDTTGRSGRPSARGTRVSFPFQKRAGTAPTPVEAPSPDAAREYRMPPTGLPQLEYSPRSDGDADPGEVVWAWVPYEDDPAQGKDRPVLILARVTGGFLGIQMTSKDHSSDQDREAHFGRYWLDIGSGPWDSQRRDSQVRLDRLLFIPPCGVRREGASLARDRYAEVAAALTALHD